MNPPCPTGLEDGLDASSAQNLVAIAEALLLAQGGQGAIVALLVELRRRLSLRPLEERHLDAQALNVLTALAQWIDGLGPWWAGRWSAELPETLPWSGRLGPPELTEAFHAWGAVAGTSDPHSFLTVSPEALAALEASLGTPGTPAQPNLTALLLHLSDLDDGPDPSREARAQRGRLPSRELIETLRAAAQGEGDAARRAGSVLLSLEVEYVPVGQDALKQAAADVIRNTAPYPSAEWLLALSPWLNLPDDLSGHPAALSQWDRIIEVAQSHDDFLAYETLGGSPGARSWGMHHVDGTMVTRALEAFAAQQSEGAPQPLESAALMRSAGLALMSTPVAQRMSAEALACALHALKKVNPESRAPGELATVWTHLGAEASEHLKLQDAEARVRALCWSGGSGRTGDALNLMAYRWMPEHYQSSKALTPEMDRRIEAVYFQPHPDWKAMDGEYGHEGHESGTDEPDRRFDARVLPVPALLSAWRRLDPAGCLAWFTSLSAVHGAERERPGALASAMVQAMVGLGDAEAVHFGPALQEALDRGTAKKR